MKSIYFFKNDGKCKWVIKELNEYIPKYLHDPIEFEGKKIKFHIILKWVFGNVKGVNLEWLKETNINYVNTIDELPKGAGIYTGGYDADLLELEEAKKRGIPLFERPCPWIRQIREQLLVLDSNKFQCVFMIDAGHMVYNCYQSVFPDDIIIVNPENYKEEIIKNKNKKPISLIVYSVFRKKDIERVTEFINNNFPHPENRFDGYRKTLCIWTKQGLLEEIEEEVKTRELDEIWVICSSEHDRSTISILNEIKDSGAKPVIIKAYEDINNINSNGLRVGVLQAPIPLPKRIQNIVNILKKEYENFVD